MWRVVSLPVPLPDTGSTGVGKDHPSNVTQDLRLHEDTKRFDPLVRRKHNMETRLLPIKLKHESIGTGRYRSPLSKGAGTHVSISLDGGADLLRARCDGEQGLALQALVQSLLGERGGPAHVLIAGVGTAANQSYRERGARESLVWEGGGGGGIRHHSRHSGRISLWKDGYKLEVSQKDLMLLLKQ